MFSLYGHGRNPFPAKHSHKQDTSIKVEKYNIDLPPAIKSIHTGYDCFLSMDRESVSTFRNSSSEAGNSSFSVWKLEFLSVETEVYNCGNAKELIAFIRLLFVLLQVADTFLFFNSIVGILFMAVFRGKRISTKGDLNNKTAFV